MLLHPVRARVPSRGQGTSSWPRALFGPTRGPWPGTSHHSILVSTDREFGQRRMRNAVGHHLWLRCPDWEAREVLGTHLDEVADRLEARSDLTIRVSKDSLTDSSNWQ